MPITPINPTSITLIATLRCTAACDNCCFGCTPTQGRSMTLEEMKGYVDMSLEAYPDTISALDLTGGECMLLGKDVDKIFTYAKSKGLDCSMVTNAFWATDYDKACNTLKRLQRSGLRKIAFSTGEDHNRYVPWRNVRNAAVAAAHLGLVTELRMENKPGYWTINNELKSDPEIMALVQKGRLKLSGSPWMQYHNKGKKPRSLKVAFHDFGEYIPCKTLFSSVIINPYGEVYACCGIGVCHIPQMRLGNIHQDTLKTIYERAFADFLKIWLYTKGPKEVLKYVHGKTGQKFLWHTQHICDICRTIFIDKSVIPVIRENYFDVASLILELYEIDAKIQNKSRIRQ